MTKQNLTGFQVKLINVIDGALKASENYKNKAFDFPCPNDYCSGLVLGQAPIASAWPTKKGYLTFCICCGETLEHTQEEFRALKNKLKPSKQVVDNKPKRVRTNKRKQELEPYEKYAEYEDEIERKYGKIA